jgi:hypothetical protein
MPPGYVGLQDGPPHLACCWRWGLNNFLPWLSLNCDHLIPTSWVAAITDLNHHSWSDRIFKFLIRPGCTHFPLEMPKISPDDPCTQFKFFPLCHGHLALSPQCSACADNEASQQDRTHLCSFHKDKSSRLTIRRLSSVEIKMNWGNFIWGGLCQSGQESERKQNRCYEFSTWLIPPAPNTPRGHLSRLVAHPH